MSTDTNPRRTLRIPDELYEEAKKAAHRDAPEGYPASLSAWVRNAIREKLERDNNGRAPQ